MLRRHKIVFGITSVASVASVAFASYFFVWQKNNTSSLEKINEIAKTKHLSRQETVDLIGHMVSYDALLSDNQYLSEQVYTDLVSQLFQNKETSSGFDFMKDPEMLIEYLSLALKSSNKSTARSAIGIVKVLSQILGAYNLNLPDSGKIDEKSIQLFAAYNNSQINSVLYQMADNGADKEMQHFARYSILSQNKPDLKTLTLANDLLSSDEASYKLKRRTMFTLASVVSAEQQGGGSNVELSQDLLSKIYTRSLDSTRPPIQSSSIKILMLHQKPAMIDVILKNTLKNLTEEVFIRNLKILMLHDKKMVASNPLLHELDKVAVSDVARKKYISFVLWLEKK